MGEVKHIEKRGFNKFHKYKYATESDISDSVRNILSEERVIMLPDIVEHTTREHTNNRGNTEYIATVKIKFTFIDGDTGEELSIHGVGEGQDAGDKAVYKAITGATKYALMKAFMIPTGDDPEADNPSDIPNNQQRSQQPNPITSNQTGMLKAKALEFAKLRGRTDEEVFEAMKIQDMTKLSSSQASAAIKKVTEWIEGAKKNDVSQGQ